MFNRHNELLARCSEALYALDDPDIDSLREEINALVADNTFTDFQKNLDQYVDIMAIELMTNVPPGTDLSARTLLTCKIAKTHIKVKALNAQERFNYSLDMFNRPDLYIKYE